MVILVGGNKGGVGKTTTAVHLAVYLSKLRGCDTLLVDADDQESAADWRGWRASRVESTPSEKLLTFCRLAGRAVSDEIPQLKTKYKHIVIDAGAGMRDSQRHAMLVADILLTPFPASGLDVWTLRKVEQAVTEARVFNPRIKAFAFLNKAWTSGDENTEAAAALAESQVLVYLDHPVCTRKNLSQSCAEGMTVFDLPESKASKELADLFTAVLGDCQ